MNAQMDKNQDYEAACGCCSAHLTICSHCISQLQMVAGLNISPCWGCDFFFFQIVLRIETEPGAIKQQLPLTPALYRHI